LDCDTIPIGQFAPIRDYEDGIQYISANKAGVEFLISSDKRFGAYKPDIKVINPEDLIY